MPSRFLLSVLSLAVFLVGATEFMVAPLLSPIAASFAATPTDATWLISGYALAYALGAPLVGLVAHRIDRRALLVTALLLLAADGLAVTLAPSLAVAIVLRVLGGLAAAALVPTVFTLIADLFARDRHAQAMGLAMLGMTAGIAGGPAMAGILAESCGWRAPFLASVAGCLMLAPLVVRLVPGGGSASIQTAERLRFRVAGATLRLFIAKALWNGTAVAGFALSAEFLRGRYGTDTAETGLAVTVFGLGLALGNLAMGPARRLLGTDAAVLTFAVFVLAAAIGAFFLVPLQLPAALAALTVWGAALGLAAPASTALLAERAGVAKAFWLAGSESANNIVLFAMLPLAAGAATGFVLGAGMTLSLALLLADRRLQRRNRKAASQRRKNDTGRRTDTVG
ncbi:MFS transporter [Nitratireductor pacificus]|uniref:Major facilitator superfamily (MFS) profile domain-containing protein n=1 Tax=Nitratireductor pacificus pht-3B TaxID=391937 RepID=K2N8H7_9HYPH|nr:hypothetical protein NA2_04102 [Nitratireductor pacificus pht-3B]